MRLAKPIFNSSIKAKNLGFTLLELMLVLGISIVISTLVLQKMARDQQDLMSKSAGGQLGNLIVASNAYISNHYREITGLIAPVSPGLVCAGAGATRRCTVDLQLAFPPDGLVPPGWQNLTAFNSSGRYDLELAMAGSAPPYGVEGLLLSNTAWNRGANAGDVVYDGIGLAMKIAGYDAGAVRFSASVTGVPQPGTFEGYQGAYFFNPGATSSASGASPSQFNLLTAAPTGAMGARIGASSALFTAFLRRDGGLPMTGDLDVGGNNVQNAQDIQARGDVYAGNNLYVAGQANVAGNVVAQNLVATDSVVAMNQVSAPVGSFASDLKASNINYEGAQTVFGGAALGAANPFTVLMPQASNTGVLSVDDIYIRRLGQWMSSLSPRYSSRGAFLVSHGGFVTKPGAAPLGNAAYVPDCNYQPPGYPAPAKVGSPKVVAVPAKMEVQAALSDGGSFWTGSQNIPLPGQFAHGEFMVRAINTTDPSGFAAWQILLTSLSNVNPSNQQAIAHIYCDYN